MTATSTTTETKAGFCTLCRSRCGTLNEVRGDALVSVRPDPSHPTGQAMCMKGKSAPELVHSPHRLRYPMRRTRPKTDADPGWVRIGWDEALAETAQRLAAIKAESGAESVVFAVTTPSGTPLSDSIDWIERFVRLFGSPNICYATEVCNWHKDFAHAFTFGCGMPAADYAQADLIVLWGHNPANTWLAQAGAIARGRASGAKMVVIDPRPTALARQADAWLPVRPGTDAALALGLVHLLIADATFDEGFVREWTNAPLLVRGDNGQFLMERDLRPDAEANRFMVWSDACGGAVPYNTEQAVDPLDARHFRLRGAVVVDAAADRLSCTPAFELLVQGCARYTPGEVERITGVSEASLRAVAELFGSSRRVAYHAWTGIGQHTNATQSERAVATLYALCGSFDRIGANRVRTGPRVNQVNALSLLPDAQRAKALGLAQRPIGPPSQGWVTARDTYRAVLEGEPYKVRAMVAFGTNLPVSQADTGLAQQALSQLEFHVHCDLFETPAARYADILLPVNTPWEREGLRVGFEIDDRAASWVQLRQRMVPPQGTARSDNDIVFELAVRLGMGNDFFGGSLERGWNHMLEPLGLTVAALRERPKGIACAIDASERKFAQATASGVRGFDTPTRRVELYSETLLRHGQPPVASFVEPADTPREANATHQGRFPYVLSSAKNGFYCHSQHRSVPSLRKRAPEPVAELGTALAAAKGIADGDWIRINTRVGHARFVARITPQLADDLIVAEFGWWQGCSELDRPELPTEGALSSNFNALISADQCDPVSGSVPHRSFLCDVERDQATERRQRKWTGHRLFEISALRGEAEGVLGIHLRAADGGELPDYHPGQHVEMQLTLPDGTQVTRAYSLTGNAEEPGRRGYSVAVRHQRSSPGGAAPEGLVSSHLHRALKVGDTLALRAPSGGFVLPRRLQQPLVFFAGGIGITPFASLLESLPDGAQEPAIWLYYANLNSRTHAFRARIAQHRARLPHLRVIDHYNAPLPEDRPGLDYQSNAYIDASVVDDALIAQRARFFMCGPPAMMETLTAGLVARGVPRFDIFSEVFRSPVVNSMDGDERFAVRFDRTGGAAATWTPSEGTLLTFAESRGLQLPSGCRVGQCESCAVRLLAGKVRHLHGTEPEDPAICLTCQAVPLEDIVLDA
ncbi:anaerobic selenocysteine-containing dehydrogenase/ferredoxin-NADP reductase [Variovorax boronicumulans]|uniref:molybdopterin-dependent oxidoreductase n=1 Tax=Variovorax TaxID=34072 RepID=UPI00277D1EB9|nr:MULTISPECIES: molybdopterin-dependent oxidoreductase [Variovorax]MDQ0074525.1 anaerobic selenocysteine-containing dehydrogenase/ferredoxin-NADP reductase [Variovorax boronicumulans]MDQ0612272.1 anaerobic selenocysteine-containing dehydrogenase/ferredoxin-NADP reductase [Variovorax sp. W1I1]